MFHLFLIRRFKAAEVKFKVQSFFQRIFENFLFGCFFFKLFSLFKALMNFLVIQNDLLCIFQKTVGVNNFGSKYNRKLFSLF